MTINKFIEAYKKELEVEYEWAKKDKEKLAIFLIRTKQHLQSKQRGFDIHGICVSRAWKAIGMKKPVTWKALLTLE